MNLKITTILAFGILAMAGCTQSAVDLDAERAALRAAAETYHEAGSSANAAAVAAQYTSDAVVIPPNVEPVSGPDGMREFATAFTSVPGFIMTFGEMTIGIGAGGDMGYTMADTTVTMDGPDGNPVTDVLRDFHLWEKENGEWKVSVDIWNSASPLPGATSTPLEGAWLGTSWTDGEGNTNDDPQPALYVFTATHYSVMFANSAEVRAVPAGEDMTDAEKLVAYDTFTANTGRYEIDGNILKTRAFVAKNPSYMGGWPDNEATYEFERDGDTLTLRSQTFGDRVSTFRQVEGSTAPWTTE